MPAKKEKSGHQSDDESDLIQQPTERELAESLKKENLIDIETVRGKKKNQHTQIVEKRKEDITKKEKESIEAYLKTWKTDKSSWKFEKRKQIYIQNNWQNLENISDKQFEICLEYIESSKGKCREEMVANAEKLIQKLDAQNEESDERQNQYNRARQLLQILN